MARINPLCRIFMAILVCFVVLSRGNAVPLTFTGSFNADDSLFSYNFSTPSAQPFTFYTTSYAGGVNLDNTVSGGGGFVPVLTVFSTSTGNVVGFGGGTGMCGGSSGTDPGTGLCEDAYLSTTLAAGSYVVYLSQFPNAAVGQLSDGFLFAGQSAFTGDICGSPGGTFLQSDVAPCVQRSSSYAVNISSGSVSPVPEPATWLLVLPAAAAFAVIGRRQFA
jgi:PEP-CTERM motif-containing protein